MAEPRSLTIRVPVEIYLEVAALAQADDKHLNTKFNELIRLGLGKHVSLDAALLRLLRNTTLEAE